MNSPVRVVSDDSGTIIHQSKNNPDYGYIRLVQDRTIIDDTSGFLRRKLVSTLLHGTIEDLKLLYSVFEILIALPSLRLGTSELTTRGSEYPCCLISIIRTFFLHFLLDNSSNYQKVV